MHISLRADISSSQGHNVQCFKHQVQDSEGDDMTGRKCMLQWHCQACFFTPNASGVKHMLAVNTCCLLVIDAQAAFLGMCCVYSISYASLECTFGTLLVCHLLIFVVWQASQVYLGEVLVPPCGAYDCSGQNTPHRYVKFLLTAKAVMLHRTHRTKTILHDGT